MLRSFCFGSYSCPQAPMESANATQIRYTLAEAMVPQSAWPVLLARYQPEAPIRSVTPRAPPLNTTTPIAIRAQGARPIPKAQAGRTQIASAMPAPFRSKFLDFSYVHYVLRARPTLRPEPANAHLARLGRSWTIAACRSLRVQPPNTTFRIATLAQSVRPAI